MRNRDISVTENNVWDCTLYCSCSTK